MAHPEAVRLLVVLGAGGIIFLLRRAIPDNRSAAFTARTGFLLAGFVFAALLMQSGLVRADARHIILATFPMVFFAGTLLFSFRSRWLSATAAVVASAPQIVAVTDTAYQLRDASHPVKAGETLILWAIGLGATNPLVEIGR